MVEIEVLEKVIPFWNNLTEKEKKELTHVASTRSFVAGSSIHDANHACIGVFFVRLGSARAFMLSEEGREITLFRVEQKESCVLSASCVMPLVTFDILVDTQDDAELIVVPSDYFSTLMAQNISVEAYAYKQATTRFSEVMWVMQQQLFMSFDRRLANFLLDEIARTGNDRINLTHEEIARNIGSAREVVTRTLKTFTAEGIIETFRGGLVVLNKQRLRTL